MPRDAEGLIAKRVHAGKWAPSRFFIRLLSSFFIVVSFCGALVLIALALSGRSIRKESIERLDGNLTSIARTISGQFQMVENLGTDFFRNSSVILYFLPEHKKTPEEKSEQWRIHRALSDEESLLTALVHDVYAFIPDDPYVLASAGSYETSFFFRTIDRYETYDEAFWNKSNVSNGPSRIVLPETVLFTPSGEVPVIPFVTYGRTRVHVANVLASAVTGFFIDATPSGGSLFAIFRSDGTLLYASDVDELAALGGNLLLLPEHAMVGQRMLFRTTVDRLIYLSLVSPRNISEISHSLNIANLILGILLVCGGIFLSVLAARWIWRPVHHVASLIPGNPKGGDEIKTLEDGIGSLLTKEGEYRAEKARHQLHLILADVGTDAKEETEREMEERYGFSHGCRLLCVLFHFDFHDAFYQTVGEDKRKSFIMYLPRLLESLLRGVVPTVGIDLHGGFFVLVVQDVIEKRDEVLSKIAESRTLFQADEHMYAVHIGVGNSQKSLEGLSVSYHQALTAVKSVPRSSPFSLVEFCTLPVPERIDFTYYDQRAIILAVQSGDAPSLSHCLDGVFARNGKRGIAEESIRELYRLMFLVGRGCLDEKGIAPEDLASYPALRQWMIDFQGDGRQMLSSFFLEVQQRTYSPKDLSSESVLVGKVRAYLEKEYARPLSLEIIAGDLGISAKYLSRIYKEVVGVNLSIDLARIRMEKAKALLADENVKVGDVASLVGIDSRVTFLRVFKKIVGVPPSSYRLLALREGQRPAENDEG